MAWDVYAASPQVEQWISKLGDETAEAFIAAVELLEEHGPSLGRPIADRITGSRHHKMKELRPPNTGRSVLRVLFAFTTERRAALLVAGDKAEGQRWNRWYDEAIPAADLRLDEIEDALSGRPRTRRGKR